MNKREREQKEYNQLMYAANKNARNALIDTLTEEQHVALSNLCADRHYMHVNGQDDIWSENCSSSATYAYVGGIMSESRINEYLDDAGLPGIKFVTYDDCDNIGTYDYDCNTDEERDSAQYDALKEIGRIVEENDNLICEYLRKIDAEYGTEYAPTGMSRKII